jgi:hypothetical protein
MNVSPLDVDDCGQAKKAEHKLTKKYDSLTTGLKLLN